jgi:hypothetical protein
MTQKDEIQTRDLGGRPTDYKPEYNEKVLEMAEKGWSLTKIAKELRCCTRTLYYWGENFPEFLRTLEVASEWSEVWWEDKGTEGMETSPQCFNAGIWKFFMERRFRKRYSEPTKPENTNQHSNGFTSKKEAEDEILLAIEDKERQDAKPKT